MAFLITTLLFVILYSITLHHFLLPHPSPQTYSLSLPLSHSSLTSLLPHLIYQSVLIGSLSHSSFSSLGASLHLLNLPLLSAVYRYFNIPFNPAISHSLAFDLLNYLGQFLLFHLLSSSPPSPTVTTLQAQATQPPPNPHPHHSHHHHHQPKHQHQHQPQHHHQPKHQPKHQEHSLESLREARKTQGLILISLLTWLLISLLDGLVSFLLEPSLTVHIQADVQQYLLKLKRQQYFLLQPSETTGLPHILPQSPPKHRSMITHQLLAPLVNLPYFFSSAALISLPSDFTLLDRLPMLSLRTKILWLLGSVGRKLAYSGIAWFLKS